MLKTTQYEQGRIAVDAVILTIQEGKVLVYLNEREKEPFLSCHELPGGLLLPNETAEQTLARKLQDITGASPIFFSQFHTFTEPKRDPRIRTVSIAFLALVSMDKVVNVHNFQPVIELPKLAFDHRIIIDQALAYLQQNLSPDLMCQFLPQHFPLNQLQAVHEAISGEKIDNRNFRKKMLASGFIKKVDEIEQNVAHRPAGLFAFVDSPLE